MTNSLGAIFIHIVFSTKDRAKIITDEMREPIHRYMGGIVKECKSIPVLFSSVEDHIHGLVLLNKTETVSTLVMNLKKGSNVFIKNTYPELKNVFAWQSGFGAFSVSASAAPTVRRYIENQKEHHKRFTFEEEYLTLVDKYGITVDRKYIFG